MKWLSGDVQKPNECDAFSERRSPHQLAIILLFISIALQFLYGIGTLAETIYLKWIGAEIYENDEDEVRNKKMGKVVLTRTGRLKTLSISWPRKMKFSI